jgi:glyoxylase-like metal-dependent hydrolase (beta-lactamase superfamily II)
MENRHSLCARSSAMPIVSGADDVIRIKCNKAEVGMKRMSVLGLAAAALVTMVPIAAVAAPKPVAPAATPFRIGAFRAFALRDMVNVVPNDNKVFGIGETPQAVAKVLAAAGAPTDAITLGVDALLVEEPDHIVLIDTGLGPKIGGVLMQSLAKAGVAPDAVTDVLITHSHGDHVGGLVTADGHPAFPKATIRLSRTEWAWMQRNPGQAAIVAAISPQVKPFVPGRAVLPGITPVALPGHTPGHVGYQIVSKGARLLDIGDSAHSSIVSLARPDWPIGYDHDKAAGVANRERLLGELARSHERFFAPHFPYPGVGTVVVSGKGYAFRPGLE